MRTLRVEAANGRVAKLECLDQVLSERSSQCLLKTVEAG